MAQRELSNRLRALARAELTESELRTVLVGLADQLDSDATGESRYRIDRKIAGGGMGDIMIAQDETLGRLVAMKVLREALVDNDEAVERFTHEALVTAHLEHPAVIPVHDLGQLADGRPFFTMKDGRLVREDARVIRTLDAVIQSLHAASANGQWRATDDGWTFHRLVVAFLRVCEAVAYAHSEHVIHRDLKPENVLVGEFGEVLVIDWGLAHTGDAPWLASALPPERAGRIRGTPAYMPPEQARGDVDALDPRADVYALGAVLYELLSGRPPYEARDPRIVLRMVLAGPPDPPGTVLRSDLPGTTLGWTFDSWDVPAAEAAVLRPPVPAELQDVCLRAMARDPADRYADAAELAEALGGWIEGSQRRTRALEVVEEADGLHPELSTLRERARQLRIESAAVLAGVEPWQPVELKAAAWRLQDQATRLEHRAAVGEVRYTQLLQAALTYVPELREAHERLADHYGQLHRQAEERDDPGAASRFELLLRSHDIGRYSAYLEGAGSLSIRTEPGAAVVQVERFKEEDRRLAPTKERRLGSTPLTQVPLARGSYRLRLEAPGRATVLLPIRVARQQQVELRSPGALQATAVWLPPADELGPDERLVTAGSFTCGGDPAAPGGGPSAEVWIDSFVMRVHPVTNRDYIRFLDALVASGEETRALAHAPRERAGTAGEAGALVYGRGDDGRFALVPDADGDVWELDWPVVLVDWFGASAYAEWFSEVTGRPWRLPTELEWEKAARGADGRRFPWGQHFDATWACLRESHETRPLPASIHDWPTDESPYGVRGLAGNVRDWCTDCWRPGGPAIEAGRPGPLAPDSDAPRVIRGGNWSGGVNYARSASRDADVPTSRTAFVGFRLARTLRRPES